MADDVAQIGCEGADRQVSVVEEWKVRSLGRIVQRHTHGDRISAVRGERPALPGAETSANWTMVGLCAHDSAMRGGDRVTIPTF